MNKKYLWAVLAALFTYCAGISLFKTWEAENERKKREAALNKGE